MLFKYKGIDANGKRIKGTLTAASLEEAKQHLRTHGILYDTLKPAGNFVSFDIGKRTVPAEVLAAFSKELAAYLDSGMTILTAIRLLENQHQDEKRYLSFLNAVRASIEEGNTLYRALSSQKIYRMPEFYLQSLNIAGQSGKMPEVLTNMAAFFTAQNKVRKQVKGAMVYPTVILIVALAMTSFLIGFVVPKITEIFQDTGQTLPPITQFVLSISDFLRAHYGLVLGLFFGILVLFRLAYSYNKRFHLIIDTALLRIPVIGSLIQNHELGRFGYILSLLLSSGVAYTQAVKLASSSFSNRYLAQLFERAVERVVEGNKLSNALQLEKADILKRNFLQALALGEESGEVAEVLANISKLYAEENDERIKIMLSLLEPVMMLLIGGIVGIIVAAMLLPIFTMTQGLKG